MLKKLKKYEEITDRLEIEITEYLTKISRQDVSKTVSVRIRSVMNVCNDLERIGDIFYQMSKVLERKDSDKSYFTPEQRDGINQMIVVTEEAFWLCQRDY